MVIFWLFLWVCFSFTPSYILWITPQDLAKWDTLLRYISVLSFINIAHVVVKLKSFKVSCVLILHPWNGPFLSYLARISPNIVRSCWNFDQRSSNNTDTLFDWKILQDFENWLKWNVLTVYGFGPVLGPIYYRLIPWQVMQSWTWPISDFDKNLTSCYNI